MVQLTVSLDAAPGDGQRRTAWKRLARKYPGLMWRVQLSIPDELQFDFPDEDRQEFFLLNHAETGIPLLLTPDPLPPEPEPEPPPVKLVQLRVVYDISVRAGPGQTYATLGMMTAGTIATFTDEAVTDTSYSWRKLADGFEGATAWIAERNIAKDRLLLSPL